MDIFSQLIASELQLPLSSVEGTIKLLQDGCTVSFISRYRKERTGGLKDFEIAQISGALDKYVAIAKRKETILKTIEQSGGLDDDLRTRLDDCWTLTELEDVYLPFKPRRRSRAQAARELGLEPLAQIIMSQSTNNPLLAAEKFLNSDVKTAEDAIKGAKDIIAEKVNEDERARIQVRNTYRREAVIVSRVVKTKLNDEGAQKYSDYFNHEEPLKRCAAHRLLAMRRGERDGFLRVNLKIDYEDECIGRLQRLYVRGTTRCGQIIKEAIEDAYHRLLRPSIENEFASLSKQKADDDAIKVFSENLRQLLLAAPLGRKRILAIDPGFRTGCKCVCLDSEGNLMYNEAIFPHPPVNHRMQAKIHTEKMIKDYGIEAIAVGNGTASRETLDFVNDLEIDKSIQVFSVSEDGASIYSASEVGREEFPNHDVTVRGAVSIGRRLMDPLAELVKIDPKNIGIGQYQHDVDEHKLRHALKQTVEMCVNTVGVNVNTASKHLLTYISGLGPTLANNIVEYRTEHGHFTSRNQLRKVSRLGPAAYEQCAGFLRIPESKNPLDNSGVHPESYRIVEKMAHDQRCSVASMIGNKDIINNINLAEYVNENVGLPTLTDIIHELEKPGLDPRQHIENFEFDPNVSTIDDLEVGMLLPGIVTNITNFGAFVDIGIHQDGLIHISQLANKYVENPNDVVKLHQHVRVRIVEIDLKRNRIALSLRES